MTMPGLPTPLVGRNEDLSCTPSLRLVADMGTTVLHSALCGGPSDRRFSKWYANRVDGWLAGELKVRKPPSQH